MNLARWRGGPAGSGVGGRGVIPVSMPVGNRTAKGTDMSSDSDVSALWGGRFREPTDSFVQRFTASVAFDRRLYRQDIAGSKAHARVLEAAGLFTAAERAALEGGLDALGERIAAGDFPWDVGREDVHMNLEATLTEELGDLAKRLHTGRSRNDQVATDLRLFVREAIDTLRGQIHQVQEALLDQAEQHTATILPGLTHLQVAQPVTFGHHLLAWFEMLDRDAQRLADCRRRLNRCPLGSAALAGTSFPLDRRLAADLLGFDGPTANSLDAVSDRDFSIEFVAAAAQVMTHLSRFSEELIQWSSPFWGFVELPDRYCTGSSIMPQKKNPDVPELIRGKTGRVNGHLVGLLTVMKGQPLAYNKDNQEDKEPIFDTVDTLSDCLRGFADLVAALEARPTAMREAARSGFSTATDLADYLVRKGVPFRDAHGLVGRIVAYAADQGRGLDELSVAEMRAFSEGIEADVQAVLTVEGSVASRTTWGGTAPERVAEAVQEARGRLARRLSEGVDGGPP